MADKIIDNVKSEREQTEAQKWKALEEHFNKMSKEDKPFKMAADLVAAKRKREASKKKKQ